MAVNSELLNCPNCTPLELFSAATEEFGKDWFTWEPETLWSELEEDLVEQSKNKLQAIQVVLSNNLFWKDWTTFEKICLAFNNGTPRFDAIEDVSPAQMAYAIRIAYELRRHAQLPGKMPVFSEEVLDYIAIRSYLDGIVYLPKPLDVAQARLNDITGLKLLAEAIEKTSKDPNAELLEDPVSIGAVKSKIITAYAYSDRRKEI